MEVGCQGRRGDKRSKAKGRRRKTAGGGKGQPASGCAINYKAAVGCLESAHRGIGKEGDKK